MYIKHLQWAWTVLDAGATAMSKMSKMAELREAGCCKPSHGDRQYYVTKTEQQQQTAQDKTMNPSSAVCLWASHIASLSMNVSIWDIT